MQLSPFSNYCFLFKQWQYCEILTNSSTIALTQTHCQRFVFQYSPQLRHLHQVVERPLIRHQHSCFLWKLLSSLGLRDWWIMDGCGSQTYWLPVKDNWNRGTKTEDRDKRENKGRKKPVTVRLVLPLTYCGFKTRSGQGNISTFICVCTILCR